MPLRWRAALFPNFPVNARESLFEANRRSPIRSRFAQNLSLIGVGNCLINIEQTSGSCDVTI